MLRLRPSLCSTVSTVLEATWALAACGVILSATCAMKVPRPTMMAAKIMMLRITPHSIRGRPYDHASRKTANTGRTSGAILTKRMSEALTVGLLHLSPRRAGRGSEPESSSPRFHPAGRHCACGILRPGMARIAPAQVGTHRRITAAPKTRQVARNLHRAVRRRQQLQHQRHRAFRDRRVGVESKKFLQADRNGRSLL